jgi:hypothetical protein
MRKESFIGKEFGRLSVVADGPIQKGRTTSICRCNCGNPNLITVLNHSLKSGKTRSCGCLKRETSSLNGKASGAINIVKAHQKAWESLTKHGDSGKRLYRIFQMMHQRCENSNTTAYRFYGKRSISVCSDWNNYEEFKKWALENGYTDELTIDRINCQLGYCPSNCRWITRSENSRRAGEDSRTYYCIDTIDGHYYEFGNLASFLSVHDEIKCNPQHVYDIFRGKVNNSGRFVFGKP